jgi:hypothetical protein
MRTAVVLLAAVGLVAVTARAQDGDLTPAKARALIPAAAGMPAAELAKVAADPVPGADRFRPSNGDSLTWLVLNHAPPADAAKAPQSFRFLEEFPNPAKIAQAIAGPKDVFGKHRATATLIQPEYVTDCTVTADGDTATGTVAFTAPGVYEGRAEFTARRRDGAWRVEEFRLPDAKIATARGADGKWVKK